VTGLGESGDSRLGESELLGVSASIPTSFVNVRSDGRSGAPAIPAVGGHHRARGMLGVGTPDGGRQVERATLGLVLP